MYAVSIGIIGGGLGTLLGTIMSGFMTQVYLLYFYIPLLKVAFYPANIITSIVLSVVFCIGAGLVGSRDAMLVTPAEAIRDEPPQTGHRILLERVKPVWERISFTWKIVFRNIFREKKKSVFISLGAAFTIAMSLMTFWISDMMTVVFETHYGEFLSMDYNIDFISPIHEDSLKDLEKILDIDGIEGKMEMPYELQYGRNEKFVSVIGLHKDTSYYNFEDFYGNRIELPDEGMLISSNLAGILEVEPGDNILVKNFIPGMDDEYIEIVDIIDQALGINGYMNIDYMEDKLAGKNLVNGALVDTDKNISEELGDLKNVGGVQSLQDMRDLFFEYLDLAVASISVMVVFSGILGFVIIYSMTVLSINERRLEFSSLRVLGFTKGEIFGIILKENAVMSVVGVIYGIPLGKVLIDAMRTIYVTDLYVFNAPITIKNVIYAIVFTTICLTLAQLITYRKITNLDFIEALKSRTS
jgi:putative ABC transport system permease protein